MYYIFNQDGKNIGQCDFEPNLDDLASRGEVAVFSETLLVGELRLVNDEVEIIQAPQRTPDELKKQQQTQTWEQIKAKLHAVTRGGVYVPSVKKWFHTDDSSRTQYLAMQIMPELPDDLMWKTMDGSFIRLTKEILMQVAMTMMTQEQSDFANAERHRQLMLKAENPLEYDYSSSWSAVYGDKEHSND